MEAAATISPPPPRLIYIHWHSIKEEAAFFVKTRPFLLLFQLQRVRTWYAKQGNYCNTEIRFSFAL